MQRSKFLAIILFGLLFSTFHSVTMPSHAQDHLPSWCPYPAVSDPAAESPQISLSDDYILTFTPVDGEPIVLDDVGNITRAVLSPDAEHVAIQRTLGDYRYEFALIQTDGSQATVLLDADAILAINPFDDDESYHPYIRNFDWINTEMIMFNLSIIYTDEGPFASIPYDNWLLNTTSSELTQLLAYTQGGAFQISPDRQFTAITTQYSLYFLNNTTLELLPDRVPDYFSVPLGEYLGYPHMRWLPDSSALIIAIYWIDAPQGAPDLALWQVPVTDDPPMFMAQLTIGLHGYNSFSISPDARLMYYKQVLNDDWSQQVGVFSSLDGTESHVYFQEADNQAFNFVEWLPEPGHFRALLYTGSNPIAYIGDVCGDLEPMGG